MKERCHLILGITFELYLRDCEESRDYLENVCAVLLGVVSPNFGLPVRSRRGRTRQRAQKYLQGQHWRRAKSRIEQFNYGIMEHQEMRTLEEKKEQAMKDKDETRRPLGSENKRIPRTMLGGLRSTARGRRRGSEPRADKT